MPWLSACPNRPPESSPPRASGFAPLRALAALALLALAGLPVLSVQAQTQELVSNTGQPLGDPAGIFLLNGSTPLGAVAQRFRTGSNVGGYNLASVGVSIKQNRQDPGEGIVRVNSLEPGRGVP